jgi:chromosomal replication initiation ATPase DnaA
MQAQHTWHLAQNHLRSALGPETFNLWFAPLRARAEDQGSLVLEVADNFSEGWLKDNYAGLLQEAVSQASGRQLEIQFEVNPARDQKPTAAKVDETPAPSVAAKSQGPLLHRKLRSIPPTASNRSLSETTTTSPMRRPWRWPNLRGKLTTRCFCTAE